MDVNNEDVKEEEGQTSTESSTENNDSQEAGDESQSSDEQRVPYSRFKETNDRLKETSEKIAQYEKRLNELESSGKPKNPQLDQVKKVLNDLGYVTKEDVDAEIKREREDARLNLELSRLETQYNGKDGLPKFNRQQVVDYAIQNGITNPEVAYRQMNFDKIVDQRIKAAAGKTGGVRSEKSDGSGSSQAGVANGDLLQAYKSSGDRNSLHTLIKRIGSSRPDSE